MPSREVPVYSFKVDWNRDGDYSDTGEDVTARVLANPITAERGRDQVRAIAPPMAGVGDLEVDNRSRDYSPENGSSPLVGNIAPGCLVQGACTWASNSYYLFTGILNDVPQHPERGRHSVNLPWLGTLSRLRGVKVSTQVYTNITTSAAITVLLDAAGWPAAARVLSTGRTTLAYWWMDDDDAFDMLLTLFYTEGPGAALYEDAQGRIVFEDRYYRAFTARSIASVATFHDSGSTGPWFGEFAYEPGLKDVINVATLDVKKRTLQSLAVIWQAGQTITLGASQSLAIEAVASDIFTAAVTPVVTTDYTVSGSLTGVTLSRTAGPSTTITLTAGASGATVTGLQLRAQLLASQLMRATNTISTAASIAKHQRRAWTRPIWPEIDLNTAIDFCNAIVSWYQQPRATVRIMLNTDSDVMTPHVLSREVSDRITVIEAQSGLNADMHIEHIRHTITKGGANHVAVFGCSKAGTLVNYAAWGYARWGYDVWAF